MSRLGFSRLLPCDWWARPDVECPDDPPGKAAQVGTVVHGLSAEHSGLHKPLDRTKVDPHILAEALSIFHGPLRGWVEAWVASPGEHFVEARYRYDAETHEAFPVAARGTPEHTHAGPTQLTAEIDFVTVLPEHIEVIDLKTGQKRNTNETQLRGYSVVGERVWKRPLVKSAFLYAKKTKLELTPWLEMNVDRIEAEAGALRRRLRTLPTAQPVKGDHCYRCPLGKARFGRCPEWPDNAYVPPEPPAADYFDDARNF